MASSNCNLKKHVKNIHKKVIPYKCEKCPFAAEYMVDLRKHVQEAHQAQNYPDGETETYVRELDNIRAKLLSGELSKSEMHDLSNFVNKMKGAAEVRAQKWYEWDFIPHALDML